ncbi:hypothetical protein [Noviherbaspirillum autotrophicum]|uniref:hypothetical protein n=1 Tax=Noviherbaspirillum autotrophicum TaxID=709839 RepID=UPI0006941DFD|nr:hypothetical protein [Noviherbaspirillum autotrophicum]
MMLAINMLAAAIIFGCGLFGAINSMSRCTRHGIRLAWVFLVTAALAVLVSPLYGQTSPSPMEVLRNVGVALFVLANRRRNCPFCEKRSAYDAG